MKKTKRGFALATVIAAMVVVFALSGVLVSTLSIQMQSAKQNIKGFEESIAVSQIANDFTALSKDDFLGKYQTLGYTLSSNQLVGQDYKINFDYSALQSLNVINLQKNKVVANVEILSGEVITWSYQEKEIV